MGNDTKIQREKREAGFRRLVAALKGGRVLCFKDGHEFDQSEMHTAFTYVRKGINAGKYPGYILCDKWVVDANSIRYKEYWFEKI